jgi:hypothetical protein
MPVTKLSKLQKRILEEGLKSYQRLPIHRAWGGSTPGLIYRDRILAGFYGDAEKEQGEEHSSCAALSRARAAQAAALLALNEGRRAYCQGALSRMCGSEPSRNVKANKASLPQSQS